MNSYPAALADTDLFKASIIVLFSLARTCTSIHIVILQSTPAENEEIARWVL